MKRSTLALLGVAAVAATLGATALVTLGKPGRNGGAATPAAGTHTGLVRVVSPQPAQGAGALQLPAIAEPYADVMVYARINGFVAEQRVELGDRVSGGQILAVIDAPEIERAYERARAALAQSQARQELARRNLERTRTLVSQGFLSQASLDEREADARVADADREAARAEAARLEELLKFRAVRAPFAGTVTERRVNRGDLVAGDQRGSGGYLFRISRLDPLRIAVDVPQSALGSVKTGAQLSVVFPELTGETFSGRITRVAGAIDPRSGTMRVEAQLPNPGGRIPGGMAGHVLIEDSVKPHGFLLPVNAVVQRDGASHVAVVTDGKLRYLPVRLGRNLGQTVEVEQGLAGGEKIAINPNALLRDGDAVQVVSPAAEGK
jgi:RND family efflux transporter MFP subunit